MSLACIKLNEIPNGVKLMDKFGGEILQISSSSVIDLKNYFHLLDNLYKFLLISFSKYRISRLFYDDSLSFNVRKIIE